MNEKVYKYKIVSWVTGALGGFALTTGVGAIVATLVSVDWRILPGGIELIGPLIGATLGLLMIFGSILLFRRRRFGQNLLLVVIVVEIGLILFDGIRYLNDDVYTLIILLYLVVPLVGLLIAVKGIRIQAVN